MKATIFALIAISLSAPGLAQSVRIDGGVVSRTTLGFYWETRLEPPKPELTDVFGTATNDASGLIHRVLWDRSHRIYVGYDVLVESLQETNTYRITFQALAMTPELAKRSFVDSSGWTQLPMPGFPAPKTVTMGQVLVLNLLTNNTTGQKIVDYVTIQEPSGGFRGFEHVPTREFSFATGSPRDFRTEDAELRIREPRLSVNGKIDESTVNGRGDAAGAIVWFYASKRGRYLLSLTPRTELGFKKAGEIRGTSLTFSVGQDTFTLSSGVRIAPGQSAFNLYVLHDPAWRPTHPNANLSAFTMGAADRAELLIRK